MLKQYAENISYEAARNVIVPGGSAAEARAAADRLINILAILGAKVEVIPSVITDETTQVTVKVEIPFSDNQWITPWFTGAMSAVSETTLLTELLGDRIFVHEAGAAMKLEALVDDFTLQLGVPQLSRRRFLGGQLFLDMAG